MVRMQVQFEEQQMEWLKARARDRGVSISQLIREGISFFRTHEERSQLLTDKKKRALAAVGRFASGAADISERHDDYLAEAYSPEEPHDD